MSEVDLGPKAFWLLAGAGFLSGFASLWALRRWSDIAHLRMALNRIVAHLFEMRLFSDEPALILRAQLDLLKANGTFLRQLTGPSLCLAVPFAILLVGIDALFAHAPLQLGRTAIVTLQCIRSAKEPLPPVRLTAPDGIRIETPPVRVAALSQIVWRLRAIRPAKGELQLYCNTGVIGKSISSEPGLQWLSERRAGSITGFLLRPLEPPFLNKTAAAISVNYPPATICRRSWPVWFSIAFFAGALVYSLAVYLR